ncbi:hypothetical protein GOP47_0017438 [Adiantum capillus-veneris]|uniref:Protein DETOXIFICATION n=1 Tax=Adiantum capillus-veneris TaxID=13818 RepID=A0A9D4ZAS1_ADICA|nr:hypothetical protein GOP47_0017438 [Adiantum capillus-veneris]
MKSVPHFLSCYRSRTALLLEVSCNSNFVHNGRPLEFKSAPPFRLSLHSCISSFLGRSRKRRERYCTCLSSGPSPDTSSASEGLERRAECTNGFSNHEALEPLRMTVEVHDQSTEIYKKGLLQQMYDIVMFAGPALGIWLSGPIMSMIDTAVVGNSSLLELAALGPGTVFCDQVGYLFMFLSVATSNLIATSMAKQDKVEAADHLSRLLFVGLVCGICMLILTGAFSSILLKVFVGPKNESLLPAACSYVQIRGLAWPAVLVGLVAQSASLGMQDAWGPLRVLSIASILNFSGDVLFCTFLKYGIAGAAWATAISQCVGGFLMLRSLGSKGYNPFAFTIPSIEEFSYMLKLAAPVLLTIFSKVCFFSLVTYMSTALGAVTLAAHQVMVGLFGIFSVSAEPLNQTAQSFMPELIRGSNRNVKKAQMLLRSLLMIGVFSGAMLGAMGTCFSLFFPRFFTNDAAVIMQMQEVILPFLWGLLITPPLLSLEGTLLAGRDLTYLSLSMIACVLGSSSLLMVGQKMEWGLAGIWWTVACFQMIRFCMALSRLASSKSIIRDSKQDAPTLKLWGFS